MTITHELIILPEAKPRMGETTPEFPGRRAVLLVTKRSITAAGAHCLEQTVFDAGGQVLWLETLVNSSGVDLIANRDLIIKRKALKSRGLGTLVLRRAVDFAHAVSPSTSVLVLSISLSAHDATDTDNKVRRDRLYRSIGYALDSLPPSRQPHQPLSDFRTGLGSPPGVQATPVIAKPPYESYIAGENARLLREDTAPVTLSTRCKESAVVEDASTPWYGKTHVAAGAAALLFACLLLGIGQLLAR